MRATTITVSNPNFPLKQGEVLKIKNANGKGLWRQYTVQEKLSRPDYRGNYKGPQTFAATYQVAEELAWRRPNPEGVFISDEERKVA